MGPRPMIHTLQRIRRPFPIARSEAKPASSPPERPPAFPQGMVEEFQARPLGSGGEMLPAPPPAPAPAPQPAGLQIEPPPWQAELEAGNLDLAALAPQQAPTDEISALDAMRAVDFDDSDWPAPGPPVTYGPLPRVEIPQPDWAEEAKAAAARIAAERLADARRLVAGADDHGLTEELPRVYPPPARRIA